MLAQSCLIWCLIQCRFGSWHDAAQPDAQFHAWFSALLSTAGCVAQFFAWFDVPFGAHCSSAWPSAQFFACSGIQVSACCSSVQCDTWFCAQSGAPFGAQHSAQFHARSSFPFCAQFCARFCARFGVPFGAQRNARSGAWFSAPFCARFCPLFCAQFGAQHSAQFCAPSSSPFYARFRARFCSWFCARFGAPFGVLRSAQSGARFRARFPILCPVPCPVLFPVPCPVPRSAPGPVPGPLPRPLPGSGAGAGRCAPRRGAVQAGSSGQRGRAARQAGAVPPAGLPGPPPPPPDIGWKVEQRGGDGRCGSIAARAAPRHGTRHPAPRFPPLRPTSPSTLPAPPSRSSPVSPLGIAPEPAGGSPGPVRISLPGVAPAEGAALRARGQREAARCPGRCVNPGTGQGLNGKSPAPGVSCQAPEEPFGGLGDTHTGPWDSSEFCWGDAAPSPCPCDPAGHGRDQPRTPNPAGATLVPCQILPPGSWDISFGVPQSTESFQTRQQDPALPLVPLHNPGPCGSSQVSPAPRTKSSRTGHQRWDKHPSGCACADPHARPIPASSEHLPSPELARASLRLLLSGCCTGDVAQSFLPGGGETFFNIGKRSAWLAVHMRRGQRSPAPRSQPPGSDGCGSALYLSQPVPDCRGQGHGGSVKQRWTSQQHVPACLGVGGMR